jgi:hypothetical protein
MLRGDGKKVRNYLYQKGKSLGHLTASLPRKTQKKSPRMQYGTRNMTERNGMI